jgi:transcriptional regulator with XRE-family HTH domain
MATVSNIAQLHQEAAQRQALETLARRIRTLRESLRMTQEELAKKCGISVSFASLLERGARSPSYETLVDVAKALEVPLFELFKEGDGAESADPSHVRLLDFARKGGLTRAQVDRFIAVGHAMFGLPFIDQASRAPKPQLCAVEGCGRPVLARGLCAPHYHRDRRRKKPAHER